MERRLRKGAPQPSAVVTTGFPLSTSQPPVLVSLPTPSTPAAPSVAPAAAAPSVAPAAAAPSIAPAAAAPAEVTDGGAGGAQQPKGASLVQSKLPWSAKPPQVPQFDNDAGEFEEATMDSSSEDGGDDDAMATTAHNIASSSLQPFSAAAVSNNNSVKAASKRALSEAEPQPSAAAPKPATTPTPKRRKSGVSADSGDVTTPPSSKHASPSKTSVSPKTPAGKQRGGKASAVDPVVPSSPTTPTTGTDPSAAASVVSLLRSRLDVRFF